MKLSFFVTIWPLVTFFGCLPPTSDATISEPFAQFLRNSFGAEEEKKIARRDLGTDGSFGGGKRRTKANKRPVIFMHGLTGIASDVNGIRRLFREKGGYKDGELYATTNGGGLKTVLRDSMKCDHIKKIRLLIRAVTQFTHASQVDIIGYSMGSPTARKLLISLKCQKNAILGGVCVDTGEKLGPPLTNLVHTFIGVGGANRGAFHLCRLFEWASFCNAVDGMRCHSKFLDDINSKVGYEASTRIYTIRSTDDGTVGTVDCDGRSVSGMDGQNDEIVLHGYSHQMVMFGTGEQQLKLLSA